MKHRFYALLLALNLAGSISATTEQTVSTGKLTAYPQFSSKFITPRDVCVWVPEDYSPNKKYDVIYMHDGQMLFDAATTWNKQEWKVDEIAGKLMAEGKIKPCIVVAVSNIPETRYGDFLPQKTLQYLPAGTPVPDNVTFNADNYLRFLVEEVKPFVDKTYSTYSSKEHTFVMGSSMGGLISLYALCEYPDVFGGAGCVSTHVPMVLSSTLPNQASEVWSKAFRKYLDQHLPKANSRRIYMDRGDQTLDNFYPRYQHALDSLMQAKGWTAPSWISKIFPGAAHTEIDWAMRLQYPLQFLVGNDKAEQITTVEPAFWWSGMKNPVVQLMVYGNNIANYTLEVNYPGVEIKSVHPMESPNYLVAYLDVAKAKPGKFMLKFSKGKKQLTYEYELKQRTGNPEERIGFSSEDVVYLLMPDRFANGNPANDRIKMQLPYVTDRNNPGARHGGDLAGIIQNLPYLDSLGITAVWTTPVLENDMGEMSYHGYAATDYYKIDPRLGTNADYVNLAAEMHKRDMKLIMDMVFNHCGSQHPWVLDPPMRDWFNNYGKKVFTNHNKGAFYDPYAADIEKEEMTDGWFVESMADMNQRNRFVADYLIQNSIWWIEYAKLDGIRQDTYPYPDMDMMKRWCDAVMLEYPHMNIVGEILISNPVGTAFWQRGSQLNPTDTKLKSVMDFHLQAIASKAFHEETTWNSGLQTVFEHFSLDFCYPDIYNVMRLLENHDVDRFLHEAPENLDAYKQAVTVLLTVPGIPQLFYGQEILSSGTTQKIGFEGIRPDMPGGWKDDAVNVFQRKGLSTLQSEALDFMQKLLQWRKGNEILSKGTMKHFMPRNGVYVYERRYNGKNIVVLLNGVSSESTIDLLHYKEILGNHKQAHDFLSGRNIPLETSLTLAPKEVMILEF